MLATPRSHARTAAAASARWPACRLPMVGTRPMDSPCACLRQSPSSRIVCSNSMGNVRPRESAEAVLGARVGPRFDCRHVSGHGGLDMICLSHEILHKAWLDTGGY